MYTLQTQYVLLPSTQETTRKKSPNVRVELKVCTNK